MLSKVFEAELLLKNKKLAVVNTDFDITVEWVGTFVEKDDAGELLLHCTRIFGNFEYVDKFDSFKRKTTITFEAQSTNGWSLDVVDRKNDMFPDKRRIFPEKVIIDFDNKTAKISF